ncbi:MAG: TrkH family potassium uptake protein [Sedimentisphaerales bacterium]|nr:TrkH family potassium uptake protein [Sedimentisphaerales bacterium]
MRNGFRRINCILHFIGGLLEILGLVLFFPLIVVSIYWGQKGDGWITATAFVVTAMISFSLGLVLRNKFEFEKLDTTGSMLMCALGWIFASAVGALPFVIAIGSNYFDAYFEAMSGFTTTGFTVFSGLDNMPRSILFWRALMQWLGGIGILSFFLMITYRPSGAHYMFGAESHKISSARPAPGLFHTLRIVWAIYTMFTVFAMVVLAIEKMPVFDAVCHAFTAVSTAGFSTHDSSIGFYHSTGHPNYRLIEYTIIFFMMLGGINFLVHYRVLTRDFKALWDNTEIRCFWRLIAGFTAVIIIDRLYKSGAFGALFRESTPIDLGEFEQTFRHSLFQVMSILTTTGFATRDISSDFFGAMSKQLFLAMMVVGGCVGSTSGGFKILRIVILNRLIYRELLKLRISGRASIGVVIDKKIVPEDEVGRVAALFFTWMVLLLAGGAVTAICTNLGPLESFSGMFSAVGNIGPCYIPSADMIKIHPVVKLTYIFGMLAGRLEILPILLLFSRKAWR